MTKKSDKNVKDSGVVDNLNNAKTEIQQKPEEKVTEKPLTNPPTKEEKKEDGKEPPKTDINPEDKGKGSNIEESNTEPEIENTIDGLADLIDQKKDTTDDLEQKQSTDTADVKTTSPADSKIKDTNLLRMIVNPKLNKTESTVPKKTMTKKQVMDTELERIRQKTTKEEIKKRNVTKQTNPKSARELLKQPEKTIPVQLKDRTINVKPNTDKVFAFLCRGYDEGLKEPCYRYVKSLTFRQVINFKRFIEEFGCMCRDRSNHDITLDVFIDQVTKDLPIKLKEYDTEFMKIYYNEYALNSVTGVVEQVVEDSEDDNTDDDDSDSEAKGYSDDELEDRTDNEDDSQPNDTEE